MHDSILFGIVYRTYLESFPQKWSQKMRNKKISRSMGRPSYHNDLKNLENFCRKLIKQKINSKEIAKLVQNLEIELSKNWEKTNFLEIIV